MAELEFERRLERMFADTPSFSDSDAFATAVEGRLDRGWMMRRWMIGTAGVVGGVFGTSQLLVSNLVGRVEDASDGSAKLLSASIAQLKPSLNILALMQSDTLLVWLAGGLAVVALGFVLTRVIEEI